ncbi:putative acetyltransferase [Lactiplantibacillus plantarum]|nr:putative acetyltransferase [Lactiplantibacillus plantarum]
MQIKFEATPANRAAAYALRQAVFVEERGIAATVEFDEKDTDERLYGVAYLRPDLPVATLRLEPQADGSCVLAAFVRVKRIVVRALANSC